MLDQQLRWYQEIIREDQPKNHSFHGAYLVQPCLFPTLFETSWELIPAMSNLNPNIEIENRNRQKELRTSEWPVKRTPNFGNRSGGSIEHRNEQSFEHPSSEIENGRKVENNEHRTSKFGMNRTTQNQTSNIRNRNGWTFDIGIDGSSTIEHRPTLETYPFARINAHKIHTLVLALFFREPVAWPGRMLISGPLYSMVVSMTIYEHQGIQVQNLHVYMKYMEKEIKIQNSKAVLTVLGLQVFA